MSKNRKKHWVIKGFQAAQLLTSVHPHSNDSLFTCWLFAQRTIISPILEKKPEKGSGNIKLNHFK